MWFRWHVSPQYYEQLDPVEHLQVSPHLAKAMFVVEDILASVIIADPAPM
jgi:hypothetical protein